MRVSIPDAQRPTGAFSLLMAMYAGDSRHQLFTALSSVAKSSIVPDQVVLVQDGPVPPELIDVVTLFEKTLNLQRVVLPENVGLGRALQAGLLHCSHTLVARFDADDMLVASRFADQLAYFKAHPRLSVLGGWIAEFTDDPNQTSSIRKVPLTHADIAKYAQTRNPMNHMTVMFRKENVLAAGGYRDERGFEDYSLWARMLQKGCVFANLPDITVLARAGSPMMTRRGGWRYVYLECLLQATLYRTGLIGMAGVVRNFVLRVPPRLLPVSVRSLLYNYFLREK